MDSENQHLYDMIITLQTEVYRLTELVDSLRVRLDETEEKTLQAPAFPVLDWRKTSESSTRTSRSDLSDFVEFLVERYDFYPHIKPCWFQHPPAVEELTALWKAREFSLSDNVDASYASWFQDLLERSQFRLRRIFRRCRVKHVAVSRPWMSGHDRDAHNSWVNGSPTS